MRGGLELERAVFGVEMGSKAAGQFVQDPVGALGAERCVFHHHVGGEDGDTGGNGPDVDVVDGYHAVHRKDVVADHLNVHALGRGLEEHVDDVAQQVPGPGQDHEGDEDRGNGVGRLEPGDHDDHRRRDDGKGPQQIPQDFEVGAADVQAFLLGAAQDQQGDQVGDGAEDRCGEHDVGVNLGGG